MGFVTNWKITKAENFTVQKENQKDGGGELTGADGGYQQRTSLKEEDLQWRSKIRGGPPNPEQRGYLVARANESPGGVSWGKCEPFPDSCGKRGEGKMGEGGFFHLTDCRTGGAT